MLIKNIWQKEKQTKNSLEIAAEAGKLYDKFVNFIEEIKNIQKHIDTANKATKGALSKLYDGKGSIISKVENLKELGAKTNKELNL